MSLTQSPPPPPTPPQGTALFSTSGLGSTTPPPAPVMATTVPGYAGHMPFARQQFGGTHAAGAIQASQHYHDLQGHVRARSNDLLATKVTQQPLQPAPDARSRPMRIRSAPPAYTERVYARTIGVVPRSGIHVPQKRYKDIGLTYGAATRNSCTVLASNTAKPQTPLDFRQSLGTGNVATLPGANSLARRQWIV